VGAWTTLNAQIHVKLTRSIDAPMLSMEVQNAFNSLPPFVNNPTGVGWDPANASQLGRTLSLTVTKHW